MEIGQKIKDLRLKNSLTLEELASRSELTKGFLSQVERDLASPSISTLSDILEALGENLSDFFIEDKIAQNVFTKEDFFIDDRDEYKISWIIPNAQKNSMEPIIIDIEKDQKSMEINPHEGEEFGYVLSGIVTIVFDDCEQVVKAGETFYLYGDSQHYLLNKHNKTASVLWITNPPIF